MICLFNFLIFIYFLLSKYILNYFNNLSKLINMNPITRKHLYYAIAGLLIGTIAVLLMYFLYIKPNQTTPK